MAEASERAVPAPKATLRSSLLAPLKSPAVRILLTIALVAVVIWRSEPQRLLADAPRFGIATLAVGLLLTVPFLYLKSLRWMYMLRYAGIEVGFREASLSLLGGMGLALLTPARLGEVARVVYLRDPRKLRLSALVMLDKLFDVLVLVLLSIAGAWRIIGWPVGAVFALIGLTGLVAVLFPRTLHRLFVPVEGRFPWNGRTREIVASLESLSFAASLLYLSLTVVAFAVVMLQFGIIIHGSAHVNPGVGLLTFPLVILTNVIPLTIAGVGIREGAAVLLLGQFHVAAAIAAISAFAMFFLNTALPGIVGALLAPIMLRRRVDPLPDTALPR
ncbi:MAG TPA: lysylphosphatidylglycerol synthase transmembrane domain-containing protein [Chloroflexota bacterium]|nr:lysylphosphatidylglycerol synthase transmembrane domain-containing protein [Chloroflexota bacterium]